jgi:enoyl-[acyl-carrier protein] reductase/trans-2-enoyl-CoA reductase (NAD+)
VKGKPKIEGAKKVLVIGASTGYGLATRISLAFGAGADTLGVIFDKPAAGKRTGTAGWYNTAAFEEFAKKDGLYAKTINGDAFSQQIKDEVIATIKKDMGQVDTVIYSLAAPRRTMPDGTAVSSVLKTTGDVYTNKTIDLKTKEVSQVTIEPATQEEIEDTIKVMGGEDWSAWMDALKKAGVLSDGAVTAAYSYIGPEVTHPIYLNGSIGRAKQHLYETSKQIMQAYPDVKAYISVNKALVTQSSAAIPVVPLYISLLYKVMKEKGLHEGCIEQMYRLCREYLFKAQPETDDAGRIRVDDWEMRPEIQAKVNELWSKVESANVEALADLDGYWEDFYQMFGFELPKVDYSADVDIDVKIASIES